jgi:hypothetical protein
VVKLAAGKASALKHGTTTITAVPAVKTETERIMTALSHLMLRYATIRQQRQQTLQGTASMAQHNERQGTDVVTAPHLHDKIGGPRVAAPCSGNASQPPKKATKKRRKKKKRGKPALAVTDPANYLAKGAGDIFACYM